MEINDILSVRYNFKTREEDTCVNSSGMNGIFDIRCDFRLSVKFSTYMMNRTRANIGLTCTNYFRSIIAVVFAFPNAQNKFRLYSLRNKMINLVMVIKHHLDFRL